ncbi:SDR family oxidoreductase [Nocardia xishanensis]
MRRASSPIRISHLARQRLAPDTNGPIDTDMNPADGETADFQRSLTALGRYGEAEDIAAAVAYLAGAGGRYVTGTALAVDGGYTI